MLNNLFPLRHPERSRGIPPLARTLGRDDKVELFNSLSLKNLLSRYGFQKLQSSGRGINYKSHFNTVR